MDFQDNDTEHHKVNYLSKLIYQILGEKTGNKINNNISSPCNYYLQELPKKGCAN